MRCSILYDALDLEQNRFFADRLAQYGSELGMDTVIHTIESLDDGAYDLVINRSRNHLVAESLEHKGTLVVNTSRTTRICNDKASTYELADSLGIPYLEYSTDPKNLPSGPTWIVKSRTGHGGTEVYLAHDETEVVSISHSVRDPLIQSVAKDLGRDMRLYMLDGKLLTSVMRQNMNDFRANFKLGGTAEIGTPSEEMVGYAEMICEEMEAGFVGVDFVFSDGRPFLNEVEDAVGTRMLYSLTDLDPAHILMDFAHSKMSL